MTPGNTIITALGNMQINLMSLVVLGIFCMLFLVMFAHRGKINCLDLLTSPDGRLSRTAIGQTMGVVVAVWAPVYTTLDGRLDAVVLCTSLAYLGGVEAYAKYLRWKADMQRRGDDQH